MVIQVILWMAGWAPLAALPMVFLYAFIGGMVLVGAGSAMLFLPE